MRKVRNAGAFALMFAASLLLVLSGCQGPMAPGTDGGTGTVLLTIEMPDTARAITPGTLAAFTSFSAVFTRTNFTDVPATITGTTATANLSVGTWSVTVNAYRGSVREASATASVNVTATGITPVSVALLPLGTGTGTFSWALTFYDVDIQSGVIIVSGPQNEEVDLEEEHFDDETGIWASSISLAAGNYLVRIFLTDEAGDMVIVEMDLHIYGNLTSHFAWTFIEGDFVLINFEEMLENAIADAKAMLLVTDESADGFEVSVGRYWATEEAIEAFEAAIEAAEEALEDYGSPDPDHAALAAAFMALNSAIGVFEGAMYPGTYVPGLAEALEALQDAIDAALLIISGVNNQANYTAASWEDLITALQEAEDAYVANTGATTLEAVTVIDEAREALLDAIDELVERDHVAEWQTAINSLLISGRGADLTPTADGLEISDRGTGANDHNNGLIIDVVGLRELYGGTPAIVITGVINDTGYMVMQGMGIQAAVGEGGAFTITLPGTTAITPDTWHGTGGRPFLGTSDGLHADFLITSIMVGTSVLFDVLPAQVTIFSLATHAHLQNAPIGSIGNPGAPLQSAGMTLSVVEYSGRNALQMSTATEAQPTQGHGGWRGLDILTLQIGGGFQVGDIIFVTVYGVDVPADTEVLLNSPNQSAWHTVGGNPVISTGAIVTIGGEGGVTITQAHLDNIATPPSGDSPPPAHALRLRFNEGTGAVTIDVRDIRVIRSL